MNQHKKRIIKNKEKIEQKKKQILKRNEIQR